MRLKIWFLLEKEIQNHKKIDRSFGIRRKSGPILRNLRIKTLSKRNQKKLLGKQNNNNKQKFGKIEKWNPPKTRLHPPPPPTCVPAPRDPRPKQPPAAQRGSEWPGWRSPLGLWMPIPPTLRRPAGAPPAPRRIACTPRAMPRRAAPPRGVLPDPGGPSSRLEQSADWTPPPPRGSNRLAVHRGQGIK